MPLGATENLAESGVFLFFALHQPVSSNVTGDTVGHMTTPLRIRPEEDEMLSELAESLGASKDQTIATLIRDAWERNQRREFTHATLDDLSVERKDLLDRLGR